jgi:hypothetical protein
MSSYLFDDPLIFISKFWPDLRLYQPQVDILYSLRDNDETFVRAGNMLGKDFITGLAVIWFFSTRYPCRIITTSVDGSQLEGVLWGEIRRFLQTASMPLPIQENHQKLRRIMPDGSLEPRSECIGRVAKKGEGFLGRHVESGDGRPYTLIVGDEASGLADAAYEGPDTWAHRKLFIGNPYDCTNFFKAGVKRGNIRAPDGSRFYRKVIQIKAVDSPNVQLGLAQERAGMKPTNELLIPGLLSYAEYKKRRLMWDKRRQTIGLDAEFYEGADVMLFPMDWLDRAARLAEVGSKRGGKRTMGVDTGEGGDDTVWTVVDRYGVLHQLSMKTPDTSMIPGQTLALMKEFGVKSMDVYFDRGGGGYQIVKFMNRKGYRCNHVNFGESASDPSRFKRMRTSFQKSDEAAQRQTYKNRRAELYGLLREMIDPNFNEDGFAIPRKYEELRRQLSPIPLWYDEEGRLELPSKRLKKGKKPNVDRPTLVEILGCSPDEADSLALAVYGQFHDSAKTVAGKVTRRGKAG